MSALYIHIPFCRKACHYCNFHFSTSLKLKEDFLKALHQEIRLRQNFLSGQALGSIYLGGGTPSLLELSEINDLLDHIRLCFNLLDDVEITLEANPEDLNREKVHGLHKLGINRLSIGIQSFDDGALQYMNRAHTSQQAIQALDEVATTGFKSYSIDLMFGLVGMSQSAWEKDLMTALKWKPPHFSCYNLTIEEQTAFHHWQKIGKLHPPSDDIQNEQFYYTDSVLSQAGYGHYEISNYALPGHDSRHNIQYWRRKAYLGIGPSAHSFDGATRLWNVSNNAKYIQALGQGDMHFEQETLSPGDVFNEHIMLGLRTSRGIVKDELNQYTTSRMNTFEARLESYIQSAIIRDTGVAWILNKDQWHMADFVIGDLFCQ